MPRGKVSFRKKADFSTFTMSNMLLKCIVLIIKRIHSGDLLDCPFFATKPPFHPRSSRCSFSKCLYAKHFQKHALLDLPRSLMPQGKVNRFRRKARHFPRGRKWRVWREVPVEPIPLQAAGESEPFSRESPALSPRAEMAGAERSACGAGTPVGHGRKCTVFARKPGTFPRGS